MSGSCRITPLFVVFRFWIALASCVILTSGCGAPSIDSAHSELDASVKQGPDTKDAFPLKGDALIKVKKELAQVIFPFSREHPFIGRLYPSATSIVFDLKNFAGLIFKLMGDEGGEEGAKKRIKQSDYVREVVASRRLFRLILPETQHLEIARDDLRKGIIVERKYSLVHGDIPQKRLYEFYYEQFKQNPALQERFKEIFRQLAVVVSCGGANDVLFRNFPLTDDGQHVILVDVMPILDRSTYANLIRLLWMAHPDFYDTILQGASGCLSMNEEELINKLAETSFYLNYGEVGVVKSFKNLEEMKKERKLSLKEKIK